MVGFTRRSPVKTSTHIFSVGYLYSKMHVARGQPSKTGKDRTSRDKNLVLHLTESEDSGSKDLMQSHHSKPTCRSTVVSFHMAPWFLFPCTPWTGFEYLGSTLALFMVQPPEASTVIPVLESLRPQETAPAPLYPTPVPCFPPCEA